MRQMTMREFLETDIKEDETVAIIDGPQPLLVTSDNKLAMQWFQIHKHKPLSDSKH